MFGDFYLNKNYIKKIRFLCHLLFWASISILYYLSYERLDPANAWILALKDLLSAASIFYATSYILTPKTLLKHKPFYSIIWIVIVYLGWALCTYMACYYFKYYGIPSASLKQYVNTIADNGLSGIITWRKFTVYILDFIYFISLPLGLILMQTLQHERGKSAKLERDNFELEIDFLKSQLNPHFLFNTLNNIYSMVNTNDKSAGETVLQLSNLMKYMLYQSNGSYVPLKDELKFIQDYLNLERIRYGQKIIIDTKIDIMDDGFEIVPLILFPFIENAFKHGPDKSRNNSWINIHLKMEGNTLRLNVSNSTNESFENPKKTKLNSGIGIANVLKRLEINYRNQYDISSGLNGDHFDVDLSIKLTRYNHLPNHHNINANKLYSNR